MMQLMYNPTSPSQLRNNELGSELNDITTFFYTHIDFSRLSRFCFEEAVDAFEHIISDRIQFKGSFPSLVQQFEYFVKLRAKDK